MTLDEKIISEGNRFSNTLERNNYAAEVYYHPGSYYAGIDKGFVAGANFTKSELMPLLEKALEALDFISKTDISENPPDLLWLNNWRNTRKEVANQTAKEIREVLK